MNCADIQELLTSYLLSDLDPVRSANVRAHLQTCAACRASADELQATLLVLRAGLADTSSLPARLPEKFMLQFQKRRWRRPRIVKPKPASRPWWGHLGQWAAVAAILVLLAGLMLPNLSSTRERARRVNDLSNLNGIWKSAAAWGLDPNASDRPAFPESLDVFLKEGGVSRELFYSTETGRPVEYYPGASDTDGDRPVLVSYGKGGRNVVKVTGSGMWVQDGTPEAEALDQQLAGLPKQVAAAPKESTAKGPSHSLVDYLGLGVFKMGEVVGGATEELGGDADKSASKEISVALVEPPPASGPPASDMQVASIQEGKILGIAGEVRYEDRPWGRERFIGTYNGKSTFGKERIKLPHATSHEETVADKDGDGQTDTWESKRDEGEERIVTYTRAVGASAQRQAQQSAAIGPAAAPAAAPGVERMTRRAKEAGNEASAREEERGSSDVPTQLAKADTPRDDLGARPGESEKGELRRASMSVPVTTKSAPSRPPPPAKQAKISEKPKDLSGETAAAAAKTAVAGVQLALSPVTDMKSGSTPSPRTSAELAKHEIETETSYKVPAADIARLQKVKQFQSSWVVSGERRATRAKFTLFKAKYQDGDWDCNPEALSNLSFQIRALSKDRIAVKLNPEVMDIGTDRLFTLKPPFVYLTGSRGITLQETELRNMRDYLMLGGALWVDSASPGKGNVFDLSVRREMKRVFPDRAFEVAPPDDDLFNAYFNDIGLPPGWANSREPVERINIGKELAVLYTLNNYGKLWTYRLDKNGHIDYTLSPKNTGAEAASAAGSATPEGMVTDLSVLNAYKFGFNVVHHLLTRYQKYFKFLPLNPPAKDHATNAVPPPEPAASNVPPVAAPVCRAMGVNPFVVAANHPFSTFSIDVDTASYTLSRNYLSRGQLPPPEAVRTEEFVNYFDYDYAPPAGPTFAVYTDCGPSAFGHGMSLLKIGVKGRRLGREEKRPAILTLLIDTSGSMATPDRIELAKSALARMVERLDPADKVAVVQYDSHARLLLEHTPVSDKKRILAVIDGLQTSGSTSLEEGMREAYAVAARGFKSGNCNRVLLLSDGMANLGSTAAEDILKSVAEYRKQGITLSVFGLGLGAYNDVMLETLANKGDGVYAFLDSEAEAKRVLVDDLAATVNLIARDVKIQVEFNPKRVKQYRQLGYENRQLKKEQFRDDTVDAGEIGSGQSVTALYELELQGDAREPLGRVRVRCRNALSAQIEEIEQPIRPPAGATSFEAMDARFRLAAAAAGFSEILRGSPFAAGRQFDDVARVLRPVALELSLDNRIQEFLRLTQTGLAPKFREAGNP